MNSPDPASLQNLNDIVLPANVGWWPLADAWYILLGLLLLALAWFGYKTVQRWIRNRYRRAALGGLRLLAQAVRRSATRDSSLRKIPILLKRAALSAYPRHQVASMTGKDWHDFMNSKVETPAFTKATAGTLDTIAYSANELSSIDREATAALLDAVRYWLQHHRAAPRSKHWES